MTGKHVIMNHFFYVTSRCNLKCPVCYEGNQALEEPTLDDLRRVLPTLRHARVLLCGAEPTCREDLPELIRAVNERNTAVLMTNGIRLADPDYVRRLREAGLGSVILAINGLDDEVYRRTNGRPLLDVKLKALENLGREDIVAHLSATITRGINEDQIGPIISLARRAKNVFQVRFRGMTQVGRYIKTEPFFMSEMTKLVCRNGGIDYGLWLRHQDFLDRLGRALRNDHIRPRLCAMRTEVDAAMIPLASDRDWRKWENAALEKPRLVAGLVRAWGIGYTLRYIADAVRGTYHYTRHPDFLRVSIRAWPDPEYDGPGPRSPLYLGISEGRGKGTVLPEQLSPGVMTAEPRRIPRLLRFGARLVRFRDLWDKPLHVGACAILLWDHAGRTGASASDLVLYIAGVSALLMGGYAANDVADFHKDRIAGADPREQGPRRGQSLAAAIAALSLGTALVMAGVSDRPAQGDRGRVRAVRGGIFLAAPALQGTGDLGRCHRRLHPKAGPVPRLGGVSRCLGRAHRRPDDMVVRRRAGGDAGPPGPRPRARPDRPPPDLRIPEGLAPRPAAVRASARPSRASRPSPPWSSCPSTGPGRPPPPSFSCRPYPRGKP